MLLLKRNPLRLYETINPSINLQTGKNMKNMETWIENLHIPSVLIAFLILTFIGFIKWLLKKNILSFDQVDSAKFFDKSLNFVFCLILMGVFFGFFSQVLGTSSNDGDCSISGGSNNEVNCNNPVVDITIKSGIGPEEHERLLLEEIEKVKAELKKEGDEKTKSLVDKLSSLEKELDKVREQRNELANMVDEYEKAKSSSDKSNENIKKQNPEAMPDIDLISKSEDSRQNLMSEIKNKKDADRMAILLDVLMADTESMDDKERKYWKELLVSMTFEQKYKLLDILSTEKRKLFELEIKYQSEISELNKKHAEEWYELEKKKIEKNGNEREIRLINIKKHTLTDPNISDLRTAERETKKLIETYPDYLDAYLYLIEVLNTYKDDRSYDARTVMEKAKDIFKNSSQFNKELGYVYWKQGNNAEAYKHIKLAALEIDDARLQGDFSGLAIENNEAALAKSILEKSYNKNRGNGYFVSRYSNVLKALGDNQKAIAVLTDYIKTNSPSSYVFKALGWIYYENKDYENSFVNFEKSYKNDERGYVAMTMAALSIVEKNGDTFKAIELVKKALDIFHSYAKQDKHEEGEMELALAMMYLETNQNDKAISISHGRIDNTNSCSEAYMMKLNWHSKALAMLDKHRLALACP